MSIAALLQAAEFLERRDRGKSSYFWRHLRVPIRYCDVIKCPTIEKVMQKSALFSFEIGNFKT